MEFKCNLTGGEYSFEAMNLLELRNKIIEQENLTELDILAGYDEASDMNIHCRDFKIINKDSSVPSNWKDILLDNILEEDVKITSEYMNTKLKLRNEKMALDNKIRDLLFNNYNIPKDSVMGMNIAYWAERTFKIKVSSEDTAVLEKLKRDIESLSRAESENGYFVPDVTITDELLSKSIHEIFNSDCRDNYVLTNRTNAYKDINSVLDNFNFKHFKELVDFCERTEATKDRIMQLGLDPHEDYYELVDILTDEDYSRIYPVGHEDIGILSLDEFKLLKKIHADKLYETVLSKVLNVCNNTRAMDKDFYHQQIEITPISVNINDKGRIELIDGYKRLLYVSDQKLLNKTAPVKVFKNVSDNQFLSLLHSANMWKRIANREFYHDRGFLFGIRQRFGIRFEDYFNNSKKDISLISILRRYDYTSSQNTHGGRYISDEKYSFNSKNQFFKSDVLSCISIHKINTEFFKCENNDIHSLVISKTLRELGRIRVELNMIPQKEVSVFEIISELYSNKKVAKKLASKENLSVPGRVDNFFREHIDNEIISLVHKHALKL